jgi:hypothetical protein
MPVAVRNSLNDVWYMPMLPWKQGERIALRTINRISQDRIIPVFTMPPAGAFDHEVGYIPTPAEHISRFGKRLFEVWGRRPAFMDAIYLDDERHRTDPTIHPLTALLERARLAGAQVWPVTGFGRSDDYQKAVARARQRDSLPVALRRGLRQK